MVFLISILSLLSIIGILYIALLGTESKWDFCLHIYRPKKHLSPWESKAVQEYGEDLSVCLRCGDIKSSDPQRLSELQDEWLTYRLQNSSTV